MVDTGPEVSVLSPSDRERRDSKPGFSLKAANGSNIKTYGTQFVKLQLPSGRYTWSFALAEVSQPILLADFLWVFSTRFPIWSSKLQADVGLAETIAISMLQCY